MFGGRLEFKRFLIFGISFLAIVMILTASGSCRGGHPAQSVVVGAPALEQNALLYVAESQGQFEGNGLNVIIKDYDNGMATIKALLNGEVDIAEAAEFPFIEPVLENKPIRIIAVNDRFENDYLIGRRDRGINQLSDLKGKKIGVTKGTILEFYLGRFLELNGINWNDITIMDTVSSSQTSSAILNGEIDAVVAFQPYVSSIQSALGNRALTWPVQSNQLVYGVLTANDGWLKQRGNIVERFLKSLDQAENYMLAHPDEARAIVQKRLNYDNAYIASIWSRHQFGLSLDPSLIVALNDEARWMINNKLTGEKTVPDFKGYIYLDALKTIKPEAVDIIR